MEVKIFIKKHFILTIGILWLLLVLFADFVVVTMDLQYDDGGLGTILILGKVVYAFPFWFVSEISMPLRINEVIPPELIVLLGFVVLDLFISKKIRKNDKEGGKINDE
ncbi:MAG: hypothetical protein H8E62_00935 [Planctomycetes bacterium]|nr:hypothetical protein [Planctomycetota bacterium]